jgi:hypothetical protein
MNRVKTPKTARERAAERGWVFRPVNPMPELVLRAAYAHQVQRAAGHAPRRPVEPLNNDMRILAYYRQNGTPRRPLTPRQQRRRWHKNAHALAQELGLRTA